ncbi:MAG TPA: WecB/TagA/CpsF family glycosyltransferase [Candidatus Sulfotelmatobacter sp.]|jgi:N-acetylglucosaminyldiphosphoundecaprenol N-acetyl-beta-D-mannosaminyltransferase|nr:WecB/TagA/CpsF family glycosyltransferase [Candidatus Sulfotelmatobacter sp.]
MTKRTNVLGVGLSVLDLPGALAEIAAAIRERRKGYICVTGVHGVMEAQADPQFKRILNGAFLCTPDGMPMVWAGKLDGHKEMNRVYGPDLMLEVCAWSKDSGAKHFFYGGADGVADLLARSLKEKFPGLQVAGTYTPPFRPLTEDETGGLQKMISESKPDIFWVGLSTPKQEKFMAEFLPKLDATLMVGVGAAFDFHSGRVSQAPRWMQRSGLEWLFRLGSEPRRLWKRYLSNNPRFLWGFFLQKSGIKKYPLD